MLSFVVTDDYFYLKSFCSSRKHAPFCRHGESQEEVQEGVLIPALSTASVAQALLHMKPTSAGNLESVFSLYFGYFIS
jgi:hypothetical protein